MKKSNTLKLMSRSIDGVTKISSQQKKNPEQHSTKALLKAWFKIFVALVRKALNWTKKNWVITGAITLLTLITVFVLLRNDTSAPTSNPVPLSIRQSVNYPVYYPDSTKMPAGYKLDENSFKNPVKNGVAYFVSYGNNKRIVFSTQLKPTDDELESFEKNYIPLNNEVQTPAGVAKVGAYNTKSGLQTLVSLPTNDRVWLIITAPYDVNPEQLNQILKTIKK